jgi:uncharacterized membrane protein YhaH (DUF805 family)
MPQSYGLFWKMRQARISRITYFKGLLLSIACAVAVAIAIGLVFAAVQISYETEGAPQAGILFAVTSALTTVLPNFIAGVIVVCLFSIFIILTIKRLHDLGYGGWLVLISLIPFFNLLLLLALLFKAGTSGSNRFGPQSD